MKLQLRSRAKVLLLAAVALWAGGGWAADVQKGYTFSDGNRVFASQLNSLVDAATILPGFYTSRAAETTLDTADVFLVLTTSGTVFKRITAGNALYNNSALITGQAEKTAPTNTDYVLLYDAAATTLKKASVGNLALGTTNLIATQPETTAPALTAYLLLLNYGTNARSTLSNLLAQFDYKKAFTNLTAHTGPTNADQLLIWDATAGANKITTLAGLFTNLPSWTSPTNADAFPVFASNGSVSRVSFGAVSNVLYQSSHVGTFTSTNMPMTNVTVAGTYFNTPHSLAGKPQHVELVLACTATDLNYAVGDEVRPFFPDSSYLILFAGTANVGLTCSAAGASWRIPDKTSGALSFITTSKWSAKLYATYSP